MDPNPNPTDAQAEPDPEAQADADAEGYLTAASRGGKDEMEGLDEDNDADAGPPSPSSSGYAAERGSSLASSGGIDEPEPEGLAAGAGDWPRGKKHPDEDDA